MNRDRWNRVEKLYHAAREMDAAGRARYLAEACAGDESLLREVESLLAEDSRVSGFMEGRAAEALAQKLASEPRDASVREQNLTGRMLSHYRVLERIAAGGMGVVYKARDTQLDRMVAIKVLPPALIQDSDRRRRFVREAKAASALNHPNIITIHEITQAEGMDCIVMELVDGKPLDRLIEKKGLRLREALGYGIQIADALATAHAAGIVHRDLKPANVMVTEKGLVKVLDFGLAKLREAGGSEEAGLEALTRSQTTGGLILGTPAYMSPEQAEGKPVDARSDIFSFGSVLYEMATGSRAFQGETSASTLAAVLSREPKPPSRVVAGLPHELERIILRCLRKDAARRFQHMDDVKVELEEVVAESDSQASVAGVPSRRWPWLLAAAAVSVLAITGWFLLRQAGAPLPPARVIPLTSYPGRELYPSFSPDGNQVAFSWDGEKQDNFDIYVKLLGAGTALRLTTNPAPDTCPAWSPDGRQIAFVRQQADQAAIYLVSPLGGPERKLADFTPTAVPSTSVYWDSISWSADGNWLAVSELEPGEAGGIFLIPVVKGEKHRLTSNAVAFDQNPAFSPDGRFLAYSSCSGLNSCDLYLLELGQGYLPKGQARRLTHQRLFILGVAWMADGRSLVYAASSTRVGSAYLCRISPSQGAEPKRLELGVEPAWYPASSRLGDRLAYVRGGPDSDIWRLEEGAPAKNFIYSTLYEDNPQFSPDGTRIAFGSNRSGTNEIWACSQDGSKEMQLTDGPGRYQGSPCWSPDGSRIAFDSQGEDGHWDICLVDAAGGQPRRLTEYPSDESRPSFSRDGKWVYFRSNRGGDNEIWRLPVAGGESERLTDKGGYTAHESWDGRILYYTKYPAGPSPLFARPVAGGPERRVLDSVASRAFFPVEDGIYHIAQADEGGSHPLRFFDFAAGKSRRLARIEGQLSFGLTVSPDRKTVLFSTGKPLDFDLMLIENYH